MSHFANILTEYEVQVLRLCAGLSAPDYVCGSAMWQAIRYMEKLGLIADAAPTERGLKVLKEVSA